MKSPLAPLYGRGREKPELSICAPLTDCLDSSVLLLLPQAGGPRYQQVPFYALFMGLGLGWVRARDLMRAAHWVLSWSQRQNPMEQPNLIPPRPRQCWENAPLSLNWGGRQRGASFYTFSPTQTVAYIDLEPREMDTKSLGFNLNLPPPQDSHVDVTDNRLSLLSVGHT